MSNIYDNKEFIELVIRHLVLDQKVNAKARSMSVKGEDFYTSSFAGIPVYKEFADIALTISPVPISLEVFQIHVRDKFANGALNEGSLETAASMLCYIYSGQQLSTDYVLQHLAPFIIHRRKAKAVLEASSSPDALQKRLNEVSFECAAFVSEDYGETLSPFEQPILKNSDPVIPTGFDRLDAGIHGLGKGQYGLVIGHSGSGKTAVAVMMLLSAAMENRKVYYFSAEEPARDIIQRLYANIFNLKYSDLQQGLLQKELVEKFNDPQYEKILSKLRTNILMDDVRDLTPITCEQLKQRLEQKCSENNFIPDVIIFDQMDYLQPSVAVDQAWQKYEKVTFECDLFSQYKINGVHEFALWVMHQATGKMQEIYSNQEISGFKGIIKPADICLCIGRKSPQETKINLFTIKSRHSKNLMAAYTIDFEHMKVYDPTTAYGLRYQVEELEEQPQGNPTA